MHKIPLMMKKHKYVLNVIHIKIKPNLLINLINMYKNVINVEIKKKIIEILKNYRNTKNYRID